MPVSNLSLTNADNAARMARALAHPTRILILEILRNSGAYVMHLATTLGIHQANVSQHLTVLREAGLVVDEREGMNVIYRVSDPQVIELVGQLRVLAERQREMPRQSRVTYRVLRQALGCRCPRCSGRR